MLIIVRHGRTEANAAGRLLGHLDLPLDSLGERQAVALAQAVGPVDRVVSSPLLRTRQTATAFGLDVEVDERFIELDYGDFDGMPLTDVPSEMWRQWRLDSDFAPPGGESLSSLRLRVESGLADLAAEAQSKNIVVSTHVSPIKVAITWALGVGDDVTWQMFVAPASIHRVAVLTTGTSLRTFNEIAHLQTISD
ncbi:MAG: histidine phosphatase family protein [Actinomycetes bacterium]